jgi:hypothetical protein
MTIESSGDTSCPVTPVTTSVRGTPAPSTRRHRLLPFFSPVSGVFTHGFPRQGRFGHASIAAYPGSCDAFSLIVCQKPGLPQGRKKTPGAPAVETPIHRAWRAEPPGQGVPRDTGAQYIKYLFKGGTGRYRMTASSRSSPVFFCGIPPTGRD